MIRKYEKYDPCHGISPFTESLHTQAASQRHGEFPPPCRRCHPPLAPAQAWSWTYSLPTDAAVSDLVELKGLRVGDIILRRAQKPQRLKNTNAKCFLNNYILIDHGQCSPACNNDATWPHVSHRFPSASGIRLRLAEPRVRRPAEPPHKTHHAVSCAPCGVNNPSGPHPPTPRFLHILEPRWRCRKAVVQTQHVQKSF